MPRRATSTSAARTTNEQGPANMAGPRGTIHVSTRLVALAAAAELDRRQHLFLGLERHLGADLPVLVLALGRLRQRLEVRVLGRVLALRLDRGLVIDRVHLVVDRDFL